MALSLIFAVSSCEEEFPSTENSITKFAINGQDCEIDKTTNTITVTVPYDTDVTKLKPSIQISEKASITPSPDIETDFSAPVKYTVTSEDGTKAEYTVIVKKAENSEKKIIGFTINDVEGTIDESTKKISLTLPFGTDVSKLIPTIIISPESSVNPASGKEIDFSEPVEYTVTAQDGTTQKYTVEVGVGANSAKAITAFSINNTKGAIDEENKTITISIPYGYDLTKLTPKIEVSDGASVSPASETQVDLSNPVKYTVTAEDGTKTEYTVSVILGKNTQKEFVAFSINDVKGTIDETNKRITVYMPAGTDASKLKPAFTISAGASANPASGTQVDLTKPVEYTITAEDGSTAKYTVVVSVEKYNEKAITKFTVNGLEATINETNKTVAFTLPAGTDVTKLKPVITASAGATVNPASGTQVDFTAPVEYTVTAEDGSTTKYTATANVVKRSDKAITKFVAGGVTATIDEANKTIAFTLPVGTDVTKLKPSITVSQGATVNPASDAQVDFTNPVEYTVTAEDGSIAKYTATANVIKRSDKAITKFVAGGVTATIDETNKTIAFTLPAGTDVTKLKPAITISQGATVNPASETEADFTAPVEYTVTAEDGSTAKYTATANVTKLTGKAITKFTVNGVDATINETAKTITYTLPAGADITKVQPVITVSAGATVSPTSTTVIDFTNPVIYTVTAEDGSTAKYTVTIKSHVLSSEKQITKFTINGVNGVIDQTWREINLTLPAGTDLTALKPVMTLSPGATVNPASGETVDFTLGQQFFVKAEDGSEHFYTVFVKAAFDLSITGVSSTSLAQGQIFEIQGQFAAYYQNNTVKLVSGSNTYNVGMSYASSATELVCQVPQNIPAGTYTLSVTAEGKTVTYPAQITIAAVTKPTITSISPTSISADETLVTITGTNFGDLTNTMVGIYTAYAPFYDYMYFLSKKPVSVTPTSITIKLDRMTADRIKLHVSVDNAESNLSDSIDMVW